MADVFLSYRNLPDRRALVGRLAYILDAHKISVWWDYGLDAGDSYREQITREMAEATIVIPFWCEESVNSSWVLMEAELGKNKLMPARLQPVAPPPAFEAIHAAHLERWDGDINDPALIDFIRRICQRLGKPDDLAGFVREQLAHLPAIAPLGPVRKPAEAPAAPLPAAPQASWSPIEQSLDRRDYEDFLAHHPQASQATEARRRLRQLSDWEQVDTQSAAAIRTFRDTAKEKSKLFPALDALSARKLRLAANAEKETQPGGGQRAFPKAALGGIVAAVIAAGVAGVWANGVFTPRAPATEYAAAEEASVEPAEAAPEAAPAIDPAAAPALPGAALSGGTNSQAEADRIAIEAAAAAEQAYREREALEASQRTAAQQAAADKADDDAWKIARSSGTLPGLQAYLDRYPYGRNAGAARSEVTRLSAYNADLLNSQVRSAVLNARSAQQQGLSAAAEGRRAAARADEIVNAFRSTGTGAVREDLVDMVFEVQRQGNVRSGYGARWETGGAVSGANYKGQWAQDKFSGYGVYDMAATATSLTGLRYEGAFQNDTYNGYGVFYWKSGHRYEGGERGGVQTGPGVLVYPDGWRYEGDFVSNQRSGYGALWTASGVLSQSGLWSGDQLVESLAK